MLMICQISISIFYKLTVFEKSKKRRNSVFHPINLFKNHSKNYQVYRVYIKARCTAKKREYFLLKVKVFFL